MRATTGPLLLSSLAITALAVIGPPTADALAAQQTLAVTAADRNNPHKPDPTVYVEWGRPTHAEMSQGYMSFQTMEERHIVVGDEIPDDVRIAESGDDSNGN